MLLSLIIKAKSPALAIDYATNRGFAKARAVTRDAGSSVTVLAEGPHLDADRWFNEPGRAPFPDGTLLCFRVVNEYIAPPDVPGRALRA